MLGTPFAMATKAQPKKPNKLKRRCSVCRQPGHNKSNCPTLANEIATKEMTRRQEIVYDIEKEDVNVLTKCVYPLCTRLVDATGVGTYCSFAHAQAHKYQQQRLIEGSSKYKTEYANEVFWEYIYQCEQSHNPFFAKIEENLVPMKRMRIPSVGGYANYVGVAKLTLKNWAMKFPEFRNIMLMLKQIQEEFLINNGAAGIYKEKITALMLMNNHGMRDRTEKTHNHLFGVVRRVYEKADSFEQDGSVDELFEGQFEETEDDIMRDVK